MRNEELGKLIGVSPSMASRLQSGERLPSVAVMDSIHRSFGVPLEDLVEAHKAGADEFGKLLREAIALRGAAAA